jgi:hypothetical protein
VSPTYAAKTEVAPEKRAEIERTLARYGAVAFSYGYDEHRAVVMFAIHNRKVRLDVPTPNRDEFRYTPTGQRRWDDATIDRAYQQALRQRWRALALVIKAKLEAVEAGIVSFEQEFLAHILLPDGSTVGEWAEPQLAEVYATGEMPAVLPGAVRALPAGGAV